MNIYAGNLSQEVKEEDLRKAFAAFGTVSFVNIVWNWKLKSSAGFGFLAMPVSEEAEAAIKALNATELKGQTLTVNEAKPRPLPGLT
ncbi:MAG TPA: RNA-binding protein [Bacteroidota bacterium]|jgi:RNA recognition motif-containing protein|nr:RNA-binding protein [Bacteroidota bacterium]